MPTDAKVEVVLGLTDGTKIVRIENLEDVTAFLEQHKEFVNVVRCKNCKWAVCTIGGKLKYCKKHDPMCINKLYYDTDFFCRDGERRENATN